MPPATTAAASSATPTPDSAASSTTAAGPGAAQTIDETLPPASSDNTAYSIDFDALLGGGGGSAGKHDDDELDLSALVDAETVDAVRSEDVDGPSDFTQNMEFWMRAKLPLEQQRDGRLKKGEGAYGTRVAAATAHHAGGEDTVDEDEGEDEDEEGEGEGLAPRPARSAGTSFNSRDHVSDSEGEDDENAAGEHGGEEEHEGSFEYAPSEQGEDTREVAAAAMQDLHGYVISDEDTFSPQSEQGSIDEQIDILSSMDDVNEDEYTSVPASPQPPQRGWKQDTPAPKVSWLQPTVEDHEDTPPPLSARPSPRSPGGQTPEVLVEDYEGRLRTQGEGGRPGLSRNGSYKPDSAPDSRTAPSKSNPDEDADNLRAQISRLRRELERQREDFTSRIASLESQLQRTRTERDESRENEQRRVRDLNAQHNDRTKDLEDHWQRRLTMAQERYEQDVQEQKTSFALVKSSFESRLSATESGLQGQIAQKEAELDAARSTHKQELEQQRAGHDAKVASLEERVNSLQSALAARDASPSDGQLNAAADDALAQQKAEYDARIAELEARLAATQSHLDASRAASLPPTAAAGTVPEDQSDELLARAKTQIADLEANMALLASQLSSARRETSALRSDADSGRESARVLRKELEAARAAAAEQERASRARQAEDEEAAGAARRDGERMLERARREAEAARREKEEMKRRAEEAVRKAGTMLNGERIEKKGLRQALEGVRAEVDVLRRQLEARKREVVASTTTTAAEEEEERDGNADDDTTTTTTTTATAATSPRSSELESLRRALRDAGAAAKQAQREAREAREEAARVRDDFVDVNRAMDERVVLLMRAREKEWQDRVAALAREKRELMREKKALGRALLQEWGREEVGEGEPQGYRYKFVKRG
ncbi:putative spindle pole body associated protein [Neofusicoccum parvum UCRNP2]|uniref:Putative spindle pole body associated protein n=1 Tax=Botryosphaeria parva (strain UCR-NP2) TaxID=1287680 RepID=R1GHR7_BOTPV|nr:putative spindle pole body associated protein [Neofusicoccum parvum UCRNP2]